MMTYCRILAVALFAVSTATCFSLHAEEELLQRFAELRSTDDLDAMAKRRFIRALVVYSKTFYFIDRGRERGMIAEGLQLFEKQLNEQINRKRKVPHVHVVAVPVSRDQLVPWLLEGRGDLAATNFTVTPERLKEVDFSRPFYENAKEIVVTAPGVPMPLDIDDISGEEVYVRRSSGSYESLLRLNEYLDRTGRSPARIELMDDRLEDEDLLEMVNAGMIPRVVVDDYNARFWSKIFPEMQINRDVFVNRGGQIAWAMRKDNPQLKAAVDAFVARHRIGTMPYNDAYKRYFSTTRWVRNATSSRELRKFDATIGLFRKYGERYGFDYLMLGAQGYQESGLDQNKRSEAGAIGVMQVLPQTAHAMQVGDVRKLEPNIHAGVKYLRQLADRYFDAPEIDAFNRMLFAFAAYNAGPTRIAQLRVETKRSGLNPDLWFNNVERTVARRVGNETVQYVANIYKYYIAYSLVERHAYERNQIRGTLVP
jgi:membrane-bound lytic murein transglycosylase MltF